MQYSAKTEPSRIKTVAIVGLGYVGLPLAIHLARSGLSVIGVDINQQLVNALIQGRNVSRDLPNDAFPIPRNMTVTTTMPKHCDCYIVCVPTPEREDEVGMDNTYVSNACSEVGKALPKGGSIVVIESTVTPGSTCGFIREIIAREKGDYDFHIAFSPERVDPRPSYFYEMCNAEKLVGALPECYYRLRAMYGRVFADTVRVGIEEAEVVKCFENTQRDVNIALMNELSLQCHSHGLAYEEVIKGLRTKPTSPQFNSGIVGGHCIPVDPYFLAEYYGTEKCLAMRSRLIHENFTERLAHIAIDCNYCGGPILVIGRAYKEGVVDTRNSGAQKLYEALVEIGTAAYIHDALLDEPYDGPRPSCVVGVVNHDTDMPVYDEYRCAESATFINIGGRFTLSQLSGFAEIVQL